MKKDKKINDYLFESNNMLLNNIWNKQESDKKNKNCESKKRFINVNIFDITSKVERFVFYFITIGSMVFPFIWFGLYAIFPVLYTSDNIIIKVVVFLLSVIAVYCLFAWIIAPFFFGINKLSDIIDNIACNIAKKFR